MSVQAPSAGTYGSTGRATTARTARSRWTVPCEHLRRAERGADRALGAAAGLDVTGQNIANVNTDGYSRQRAELQSLGGSVVPAFFSTSRGIGAVSAPQDHPHPGRLPGGPRATRVREQRADDRGLRAFARGARFPRAREDRGPGPAQRRLGRLRGRRQPAEGRRRPVTGHPAAGHPRGGIHFGQAALGAQWGQTRENLDGPGQGRERLRGHDRRRSTRRSRTPTSPGCRPTTLTDQRDRW